jgi:ketosteroid isomerase-like protein
MIALRLVLIASLAACAASPAPPHSSPPALGVAPARAVEQWVREVTAAYERADVTTLAARLDPDGVFVGTNANDVWDTAAFRDAQAAMLANVKPGTWHITNQDLRASVSPDGKSAWMRDTLLWDRGDGPHPLRWTAVLVNRDGKWLMSASHLSIGVADDVSMKMAAAGQLPQRRDITGPLDPAAKDLLEVFDADLADVHRKARDIAQSDETCMFGTAPEEIYNGPEVRKQFSRMCEQYKAARGTRNGGASVHFAPGGQLGWVVANVDMMIEYDGKPLAFPSRTLIVYLHGLDGWKIVQIHSSNAAG